MADKGYTINGQFFPAVPLDDWLNRDFIFAKKVAECSLADLFAGRTDALSEKLALGGIAFWHANPQLDRDKVIQFLGELKPTDIEEQGFDEEPAADVRPPEEQPVSPSV